MYRRPMQTENIYTYHEGNTIWHLNIDQELLDSFEYQKKVMFFTIVCRLLFYLRSMYLNVNYNCRNT